MKLLLVLMVCAVVAAAPKLSKVNDVPPLNLDLFKDESPEGRNLLVNALVRQLFAYLRHVINNGSYLFGIPVLDPLELDHYHLVIPAGLINLDLELKNIFMVGVGGFVVNRSDLNLQTMTFNIDITVPAVDISAGLYDLTGDLFTAIPLYGKGTARFLAQGFRFRALLHLKQSADRKSILIERIDNPWFELPSLRSELTGAIGGGDIDAIVNAMISEVIVDYINRFHGAISLLGASAVQAVLNPILGELDTWRFIEPLIPRN